jgi:hypothetical protein
MRMEERTPKEILQRGLGGKKKPERPRTIWKDAVIKDIDECNEVKQWKNKRQNREEWREIFKQAFWVFSTQSAKLYKYIIINKLTSGQMLLN